MCIRDRVDTILACISEPLDPSKLATFDIEYMFTQIRSKSVGESAKVNVKCEECDTENEIAVDLGTAEVEMPEDIVKKVEITKEVSVELKFPSYEVLYDMKEGLTETAMTYDIVNSCIDAVVTEDERIDVADVGKEELNTFIESMNGEQFKRITDFVQQNSEIPFDSIYKTKGNLANEYADILFGLNPGDVFGPYKDGNELKISRFLDRKKGGAVRASHILIAYQGASRTSDKITRTKEEAKIEANRVLRLVRRGKNSFEELAAEYSDGPSYNRGGDLGFFQEGQMAQEFFNYVNQNIVPIVHGVFIIVTSHSLFLSLIHI